MFRNQYDTDVTTWSPTGRLHQIEYAMEAVKQGSAAVGLRSKTHVVLAALKRAPSDLASFQQKIHELDAHCGVALSGLTADGRVLCRYMRGECLNHRFVYESPLAVSRLVSRVADRSQVCTHRSYKRPYGVGMLVAGVDATGPRLFQTDPSGNAYEYVAQAMGARSQAARTYLERTFETYADATVDALCQHALFALKESAQDNELTTKNCSLGIAGVGDDGRFKLLDGEALKPYLDKLAADDGGAQPMDT